MSGSKEWTEWHLTINGWEKGSYRVDFGGTTNKNSPKDRVLTMIYYETITSSFSPLDTNIKETWISEDKEQVNRLLKQYGNCPAKL